MRNSDPLQRLNRLLRAPEPPFTHGMQATNGPKERERWLEILKLLQRVQKFAAGSQTRDGGTLLGDVRESVVDAVRFLIDGDEVVHDGGMTKQIRVWSSPQNARLAILQEAIALAHSKRDVRLSYHNQPPLIILISERHEDGSEAANETLRRNFLDSWSSTCYGVGEVLTIQGDTSQKIRESLRTLFDGFSPSEFFPVLMVIHASPDSTITSNLSTLKRLGDAWNVRLCVEGPALAMLAQSNRPSDPEECAVAADVMLLDPAAWFGFRMCALVTLHKLLKSPVLGEFRDHYSRLLGSTDTMKDYDETNGLAMGPMLNLWTVLSKIGLSSIRNSADVVTILAESLVSALRDSPNIVTTYEGIGCGVRISYALSREDRLLPKEKSREHVSLVNSVVFASLAEESEALFINLGVSSDGTFLQFSPVKLLSAGTFWLPTVEMFADYAKLMQKSVDKYESCRAGSVAFRSCVAKCREIQFLRSGEEHLELHLSFAAFRIVPAEFGNRWHIHESCVEIVEGLTALVSKELTESPHDVSSPQHVVQEETERARALAEQFNRKPGRLRSSFIYKALSRRHSFPHGYGGSGPLPFDIFLYSDSENSSYDFISIEPRGDCEPVHAVNQATVAADLMIACVIRVMESWRAGEITLPLERDGFDRSGTKRTEDRVSSKTSDQDTIERAGKAESSSPLHGQSLDQFNLKEPLEAPGSEVSRPTLSSREEQSVERPQEFSSEMDQSTFECNHSTSTGDFDHEIPPSPEASLRTSGNLQENHSYRIKDVPSSSTIERLSSKGTRTDEEENSPDCVLPTSAKAMKIEVSENVLGTNDLAAAIDAIPVSQAVNKGRWFGSWRARGLSNQNEGHYDESDSSSSEEESSASTHGQTEEQDSSEDSDGDEEQESDSSSSDRERDDRSSKDDSSSDSNHDSANETDDSNRTTSSESSNVMREDVDEIQKERASVKPSSAHPGPTSRLLSWIRPSTGKPYVTKSEQKPKGQRILDSDSEDSTSQSGCDEGRTQQTYGSSEEEEEQASSSRTTSSQSSRQQAVDVLSDDSEYDSSIGEERFDNEASQERDVGRKAEGSSWTNPRNRGYGFGWFKRTGESSKPNASRTTKSVIYSEAESASSSDAGDESESLESGDADRNRRKPVTRAAERHDRYSEDESSERTYVSGESGGNSFAEDTSDIYDSSEGNRLYGTSRRDNAETDDNSGSENGEERSKNIRNSGSFLAWMLPSWATTPPKFREPQGPSHGINSRLGIPLSSGSSSDLESEESRERQRRAKRSKKRTPYGRDDLSLTVSKGNRNRRRPR